MEILSNLGALLGGLWAGVQVCQKDIQPGEER